MGIVITPYLDEHVPQVKAFNERLTQHGVRFRFPESSQPHWLPPGDGSDIFQEQFVAIDDTGYVRGGYILKHQPFLVGGEVRVVGNYQLPLSEGIIDRAYSVVALQLLGDALKRQPLLYCLGMGGLGRPLPKMLKSMGWATGLVPFLFRVINPKSFLRNITHLRTNPARRIGLDLLAGSGLGGLVVGWRQGRKLHATIPNHTVDTIPRFDTWADDIWQDAADNCSMIAVRGTTGLQKLYPENESKFLKLQIRHKNQPVGWAVCLDTQLENHKQFGSMRLGSLVDCVALSGHESAVCNLAVEYLTRRGVDLIVSNQMHTDWVAAMVTVGMSSGPSNFGLALSASLVRLTGSEPCAGPDWHFNRGDGDGPINL